jgi:hypothetical protein
MTDSFGGIVLLLVGLLLLALWLLWSILQASHGQSKTLLSIVTELRKGTAGAEQVDSVTQIEILGDILQELRKRAIPETQRQLPIDEELERLAGNAVDDTMTVSPEGTGLR